MKLVKIRMSRILGLSLLMAAIGGSVQAQGFFISAPAYGGSGCPAGTATLTSSPDSQESIILFDQFYTDSWEGNRALVRKACALSIPVEVPQGFRLGLSIQTQGTFWADPGGSISVSREVFLAGNRGQILSQQSDGPDQGEITLDQTVDDQSITWSDCGESTNLRANLSLRSKGPASIQIDALRLQLHIERCR